MSPRDILEKNGDWMFYTELRSAVANKYGISGKQAYRRMEKARKNKEIVKVDLAGRRTIWIAEVATS